MSQVVLKKCYQNFKIKELLLQSLEELGGINKFISTEDSVLIKPNFVGDQPASRGATTSLEIVRALCEIALDYGATEVYIAESPATCYTTKEIIKKLKILDILKGIEDKVTFINLNEEENVEIEAKDNIFFKKIPVPKILTRVDRIWNVPKAKVHYVDRITCAIKNYVAFLPNEFRLKVHQTRLSHIVASLHKMFPETLVITDALVVGEGEGPLNVRPVNFGYIVAADDPVANDVVVGKLLGFDPEELEYTINAYNIGVGEANLEKIILHGTTIEKIEEIKIHAKRPVMGIVGRYKPFNIILGGACSGCLTWFKGTLEGWILDGSMKKLEKSGVRATVMIGFNAEDERFEEHLKEGPYFVIGDCAPEKYKNDPRVVEVRGCCPGHEIPNALSQLLPKDNKEVES